MSVREKTASTAYNGSMPVLRIICFLLLFFPVLTGICHSAGITVTATLNRASMPVGETAELVVTVNGAGSAELDLAEVDGLEFTRRGHSRQLQIINGNATSSLSTVYLIQAVKSGTYTIPAVTVEVEGKKLQTDAIPFEVTASLQHQGAGSASSPPNSPAQSNSAFLRIEVQAQSFVGERVPLLIHAYFPQSVQATIDSAPSLKGNGFVMEQLGSRPRQTMERLNGTAYNVLSWNTGITGIKEGRLPFQLQLEATYLVRRQSGSSSPFASQGPFANDILNNFLEGLEKKPVRITTPENTLEVLPLPKENQPQDFSGAIGDFALQVKAVPTSVEVGQPLSISMVIEGTGNFDRVEAPVIADQPGWKSYSPSSKFFPNKDGRQGSKVFEQAIVIKDKAINHIPQISFSYFDPKQKQYVTRTSPPIPLKVNETTVQKTAPSPVTATAVAPEGHASGTSPAKASGKPNLAPIHSATSPLSQSVDPLFPRTWILALVICCAFGLVLLLGIRLRNRRSDRNPADIRKKQMMHLLFQASADLERAIANQDSQAFLSRCRLSIQQQAALCWQIAVETITLADITTRLGEDSALAEIFAAAEKGAYAGYTLSPQTMREYADTLVRECRRLP